MLNRYPDFKKERIRTRTIEAQLGEDERRIVDAFIDYCAITAGEKKCRDTRSIVLQIRHIIQKPYSSWTLDDLRGCLALLNRSDKRDWTTQGVKIVLKRFLKWHYPDWSDRFNSLEDIRLKKVSTQDRFSASNLLSEEEVESLIRAADRAIVKSR